MENNNWLFFLNNVSINNNTTLLSSLNVGGITTLKNTTYINGHLNVSVLNVLNILNEFGTDTTNSYNSIVENQNQNLYSWNWIVNFI